MLKQSSMGWALFLYFDFHIEFVIQETDVSDPAFKMEFVTFFK